MTTPNQLIPDPVENLLGIGAFQIGGGGSGTNFGQDITEDFVDFLVKIPIPNLTNMLDVLEQVLLKLPLEALEAFKSIVPGLEGLTDIVEMVDMILDVLDPRQIPATILQIVEAITGLIGGDLSNVSDFFTNLLSLLGGPSLLGDPGSFNPVAAVENFITLVMGPTGLLATLENIVDAIFKAITGASRDGLSSPLDDLETVLRNIPGLNIIGAGGLPNVLETFEFMWDGATSALNQFGVIGSTLGNFFDALFGTSLNASSANELSTINTSVLGIRTNQPVNGALERTTVANFPLTQLGTGATPSSFAVTQTSSAIALLRMPESDVKGALYWRSSGDSVTGFYINFGTMALDGTITHHFQSSNLVGQLTPGWLWQAYTFPGADKITHLASEVLVVEYIVVGSGTVTMAGLPMAWQTDDHPVATTARSAGERDTQALGGHPTLSNTGFVFTGDTPWTGLGRSDVPESYIPPEFWSTSTFGSFTYTIPVWARVNGYFIDVIGIGAGGGGGAGGYGLPNRGGRKGNFNSATLVYGVDITPGTTAITGSIAVDAAPGVNPFLLDSGQAGGSTTIVVPGYGTITCTGGAGGSIGGVGGQEGEGAGYFAIDSFIVFGGGAAGVNQHGITPGGGGGAGYPATGQYSGGGKVWFRARQGPEVVPPSFPYEFDFELA